MTQTNNNEALLDKLLAEYWDIAYSEGNSGLWHGEKAQSTLNDIRKLFKTQSPISQNEQQEAVGFIDEADDGIFGDVQKGIAEGLCKVGYLLYTSPPKQAIPEGWKLVQRNLTKKQKLAMVSAYEDAMGGCRLPDGDGYDEEIVQQMYDAAINSAPTTSLTSETNTEVGE